MAQSLLITLTTAGSDTGPFSLYSNVDGFATAFETGISRSDLQGGYVSHLVPDGAIVVRVASSNPFCENYVDLSTPTTSTSTTTSTTTVAPTTTTTTTEAFATVIIQNEVSSGLIITSPFEVSGGGVFTVFGGSFPINPGGQVTGRITPVGTYDLTLNGIRSLLADHKFTVRGSDLVESCQDMESDDGGTIDLTFNSIECFDTQSGFNLDVVITIDEGLCE